MSVIIRLQNLPWSANALDIRQFFKGLSIPEGGVHIVGGEMGDAFIAFSTDEDARQAMMHDRECIKEVQVRLLLSSRAEMQKVIETARLQSISLLQQMALRTGTPLDSLTSTPNGGAKISATQQLINQNKPALSKPQPVPQILNMNNLQGPATSFLAYQQQAGITLTGSPILSEQQSTEFKNKNDSSSANDSTRRSIGFEDRGNDERDRPRSSPRDHQRNRREESSRSRSRDRENDRDRDWARDRGRERERDRDRSSNSRRQDRSRRSHSRESRDRSADRSRNQNFNYSKDRSERDSNITPWAASLSPIDKEKPKTTSASPWATTPVNAYQTNQYQTTPSNSYSTTMAQDNIPSLGSSTARTAKSSIEVAIPAFQNYTSNITPTNNYSINLFSTGVNGEGSNSSSESAKPFTLQNPYSAAQQNTSTDSDSQATKGFMMTQSNSDSTNKPPTTANSFQTLPQEPIAFAKTNPYEQMYPNLFAQAAAQSMPRSNATAAQRTNSPIYRNNEPIAFPESSSIKVSNMCSSTNYSDLRKFFAGLFIPHNGIKMVNDRHGLRIGVAFIQFSRQSSVIKALTRNHSILKSKSIKIEVVPDDEFAKAEDSYRPSSRFDRQNHNDNDMDRDHRRYDDGNSDTSDNDHKNPFKKPNDEADDPYNVLYIEELPPLTTEQDIMKMFSSYTLYDILLMPSVDNRREYVAYVKFSLAEDAKAAFEEKSKHLIGYRKVRVQPGKEEAMEMAKEKLRLANEQLIREEQEEEEAKSNKKNEKPFKDQKSSVIDLGDEDDEPEIKKPKVPTARNSTIRDPRLIPSLFDMPTSKPSMDGGDTNSKVNTSPADPRLRTRQRPSRFDSDTKNVPTNNVGNSSNMNNDNNNGGNKNDFLLSLPNNQFLNNANVSNNTNGNGNGNGNGNFNEMFRLQQLNSMEDNFVLLYNCPYNIRNNDVGELFLSANLQVKHVEMLNTERGIPAGEFIVEVTNPRDADLAVKDFHNIQFHGRNLRVRHIKPQEIADRLRKPFMNYIPGGNGNNGGFGFNNMGGIGLFMNSGGGMRSNNRDNDIHSNSNSSMGGGSSPIRRKRSGRTGRSSRNNFDDVNDDVDYNDDMPSRGDSGLNNNNNAGIPEKFTRPESVLAMENVPYKADSEDILRFFGNFDLRPDDIIRRFNDEGAPTGDARVAFQNPCDAREAYEKLNRKQIFNRTIYLNIL